MGLAAKSRILDEIGVKVEFVVIAHPVDICQLDSDSDNAGIDNL